MDEHETAAAREDGTSRAVPEADARIAVDHVAPAERPAANVGRASAPTLNPPDAVPETAPATPTTYRAGQLSTTESPIVAQAGELPVRKPGRSIQTEASWEAFGSPPAAAVTRARASVPGAAPVTAADMVGAVQQGAAEPRTYRAGDAAGAPADPPAPVEPPPPPQPPEPVSPPEPPSPPQPAEPPPGPSPFPSPTPVPTPPRPVPPEPPTPEPEPGPPHPPSPPLPPPPGPSPLPPFPPPPPAIDGTAPAGAFGSETLGGGAPPSPALPSWPPSLLSGPQFPTSAPPASSYYPPELQASGAPTSGAPASFYPPEMQPSGTSATGPYDGWAHQGHPQGTVYSGSPVTSQPITFNPVEQSGSLTGHILSQGTDTPPPESRNTRVIVIMTVVLAVVVIAGLTFAVFARNALTGMLGGG